MDLSKFQIVDEIQYNSKEVEEIVNAVLDLPDNKKLEFNYKDTDDFKHPIGDITGFAAKVRASISNRLKQTSKIPSVLIDRDKGSISIYITLKK